MVAMGDKCLTDGEVLCMYAASEEQLLCGAVNKISIFLCAEKSTLLRYIFNEYLCLGQWRQYFFEPCVFTNV